MLIFWNNITVFKNSSPTECAWKWAKKSLFIAKLICYCWVALVGVQQALSDLDLETEWGEMFWVPPSFGYRASPLLGPVQLKTVPTAVTAQLPARPGLCLIRTCWTTTLTAQHPPYTHLAAHHNASGQLLCSNEPESNCLAIREKENNESDQICGIFFFFVEEKSEHS